MFFILEFQKDHVKTLRFSTSRKNPILGAKWGCWLWNWTSQINVSHWCCQGRAWCAGPIINHTSHSVWRFSLFYFQVVAKTADGAQAKIAERFARQATDECTHTLLEKSVEFSRVTPQKLMHIAPADRQQPISPAETAILGHCIAVPVQTIKTPLVALGQSKVSCFSAFSASIDGRVNIDPAAAVCPSPWIRGLKDVPTAKAVRDFVWYFQEPEKQQHF